VATDSQLFREARMDIDLVKDEVESCLDREIEVIRYKLKYWVLKLQWSGSLES